MRVCGATSLYIHHRVKFVVSNTQISNAPTLSFFNPRIPNPPCATKAKKITCTHHLVFATIKINKETQNIPRNPAGQKAEIAVRCTSGQPWPMSQNSKEDKQQTKTPLRQMFINKHAPIPFTREQWQPRYLPSFLSNSNKAPRHQARASHIARACHHTRFFSEEDQTFSRTNTKSHFNPYSSAIKTPSSMLPNIDIL